MGKLYEGIDGPIREFIEAQRVFFVATAPTGADGHVNLSPKGCDSLRILDEHTVAYLDYIGSGVETIAHVRDNGRITVMLCAFDGPPKIVRLHGRGEVFEPVDHGFAALRSRFPSAPADGVRAILVVHVTRIGDSCGYGVPLYEYTGERTQLDAWSKKKGPADLEKYQRDKNRASIDGLPGLRWVQEKS